MATHVIELQENNSLDFFGDLTGDPKIDRLIAICKSSPNDFRVANSLANYYLNQEMWLRCYQVAKFSLQARKSKNNAWIYCILSQMELGNLEKALSYGAAAAKHLKKNPHLTRAMAHAYYRAGMFDKSLTELQKYIKIGQIFSADEFNIKALCYQRLGNLDEALVLVEKGIKKFPESSRLYNTKGNLLNFMGNKREALSFYIKCVELEPLSSGAIYNFCRNKKFTEAEADLVTDIMDRFASSTDFQDQILYGFSLFKICDDLGDYESAANFCIAAGRANLKKFKYEISATEDEFRRLKTYQPLELLDFKFYEKNRLPHKPLFIVGMPRSGTTLLEQIVSNHSKVTGLGELTFMPSAANPYTQKKMFESQPLQRICGHIRYEYLKSISMVGVKDGFFTDKLPSNSRYIGYILNALPEAKILYIKRDDPAVCFSNFTHNFPAAGLSWTFSQQSVRRYNDLLKSHMSLMQQSFPDRIHEISYESLVENPEKIIPELIQFCGLDFEQQCLTPETNKKHVITASVGQATAKIYKGSGQKWKKYKPFLPELFDGII